MSELSTQPSLNVVREDRLTFPHISGLLSLAGDYPRLLPVAVNYVARMQLTAFVDPEQEFGRITIGREDHNILLGLNNSMMRHLIHQYRKHDVCSVSGRDLINMALTVADNEENMGLAIVYPYEDNIEYLHLPSKLFRVREAADVPHQITQSQTDLSVEAHRELNFFFQESPEVREVYYADQMVNQKRNPCLLIVVDNQYCESRFIFTVPELIMEKQGFKSGSITTFFHTESPDSSLPFKSIYQRK